MDLEEVDYFCPQNSPSLLGFDGDNWCKALSGKEDCEKVVPEGLGKAGIS